MKKTEVSRTEGHGAALFAQWEDRAFWLFNLELGDCIEDKVHRYLII